MGIALMFLNWVWAGNCRQGEPLAKIVETEKKRFQVLSINVLLESLSRIEFSQVTWNCKKVGFCHHKDGIS